MDHGYPYVHIAGKHAVPYEKVLAIADFLTHGRMGPTWGPAIIQAVGGAKIDASMVKDIRIAVQRFKDVQTGKIPAF